MPKKNLLVDVKKLNWRCNPEWLPADRSDLIAPAAEIIGQERALEAIQTGLGIQSHGYNIYVAGLTGTGKMTTIQMLLESITSDGEEIPGDICYVNNFDNPNRPIVLYLRAGQGKKLAGDVEQMVAGLSQIIPGIESNEQYHNEKKTLLDHFKQRNQEIIQNFEKELQTAGLAMVQLQIGEMHRPAIFPVYNNEIIQWEQLYKLAESKQITQEMVNDLREKHDYYVEKLDDIFVLLKSLEAELEEKIDTLRFKFLKPTLRHWRRLLKNKYDNQKLQAQLDCLFQHIAENLDDFVSETTENQKGLNLLSAVTKKPSARDPFFIYRVNVVVDNSNLTHIPIVTETAPSFQNLFGTIEHKFEPGGVWQTDFMQIKAGSLLQANGGYLVFNFLDAISDFRVWTNLKRILKNNQIIIQAEQAPFSIAATALKPEPIRVNLKVLVIGDYYTYHYLYENDDEFRKIFKIRADFDTEMENDQQGIQDYGRFISKICKDENLLPCDRTGMAVIVEEGVRIAGRNNYLSTRFSDIADLIRESHYWAKKASAEIINESHVNAAIRARKRRLQMSEDKLQKLILNNVLLIETEGKKIGQVNGISIYDLGDYSFGKPSKITAEAGIGHTGIINIEREADLGGNIYNKGVLIIAGFLNGKYAQDWPLTINASICFEQSYSGVDGDSASAAEIFALLSGIGQLPLRQDLAVTGSINQKGEIQPIGGVNEKIEGVFEICRARGFSGNQGVIIPRQNIPDLMLRQDVIQAITENKFHIYAINTIDEGIELLTDMKAGVKNAKGGYPKNSVHYLVQKRLQDFAEKMKDFDGAAMGN